MADADAVPAEPRHLAVVEMDAMRQPGALVEPADLFQIIERPHAEAGEAEVVLVLRLAEMGVQPAIMLLGELRGGAHHGARHVERRAGRERHRRHRARRRVVIAGDDALAIGEHGIVVLHQPLVGDAARFHALG